MKTLLLHGFTGRARSWRGIDGVAIDLPGHGGVPVDVRAGFEGGVDFVAETIRRMGGPVHLVGYSLGGRLALGTCVAFPDLVARATLIAAGIGIDDAARGLRQTFEADVLERLRSRDLDTFLGWWSSLPLFATQAGVLGPALAEQDAIRRTNDPLRLADAFEAFALSTMPDYRGHVPKLVMPARYVVGEHDSKYREVAKAFEDVVIVDGVGHNVLLERPDAIVQITSV